MARKPTQTTEIANYDEELAKYATAGASLTTSGGGGKFFTLRAGVLSFDDTPLPGNQMVGVIAAWCLENVYYGDDYDPDNRAPPTCFAFCKDPDEKDEMEPHPDVEKEDVFERQSEGCADCPHNQWGSAAKGRGKACSNRRRLAILPGGSYSSLGKGKGYELEMFYEADHYKAADAGYLKVPVTSGKGFDAYVKQLSEQLRKPTFAVFTRIYIEPDPKSQFKVCFELMEEAPNELIPTLLARHKDLDKEIDFPYRPMEEDDKPAAKSNAKLSRKAPAKKGRR